MERFETWNVLEADQAKRGGRETEREKRAKEERKKERKRKKERERYTFANIKYYLYYGLAEYLMVIIY